jgi:hypothetical protein
VGKKYIIEMKEGERLYKTKLNALNEPVIREITCEPYTEPDMEQVRKEAYQKGLSDAWEAARKIASDNAGQNYSIFGQHFTVEILNTHSASEVIEEIRAYEQAQKEKEEQIQVGDEVDAPFGKAIVVNIDSVAKKIWVMYANGRSGFDFFKNAPTKTGRHFPEIAEVMRKMKENNG